MSIGLGIIGAGSVARLHAEAATKAGVRLACICDLDGSKARALAAEHAGAEATDSVESLLGRSDIDAVVVAVPNCHHKQTAIDAMRAGKDILLEKPMAMSVAECDEINAVREQTGQLLQMGFVCRGAPAAVAAHELAGQGRLGRIYHVKASLYRQRGIPGLGRWFTNRAMSGGGALMDVGVHLVDLAMHMTGSPAPGAGELRVHGNVRRPRRGVRLRGDVERAAGPGGAVSTSRTPRRRWSGSTAACRWSST